VPLRLPAFAKINLELHVLGHRPDGYHELRTVFQAISLHDTLELERTRQPGIRLEVHGAAVAADASNLVWRALDALQQACRCGGGWCVRLEKRIPVQAGLGGGSSDAAAALIGGLRLLGRHLAPERLLELAAGLGADVPFFLLGGRALGLGRGEQLYPLPDLPRTWVVVVQPDAVTISTAEAYRWLDQQLTLPPAPSRLMVSCIRSWSSRSLIPENDFEPVVFERFPGLRRLKRRLLRAGAAGAALAGSGSAVFGLFPDPAHARRAAAQFSGQRVWVARTLTRGSYRRWLGLAGVV
jgi:4-diphosphocytidyl-2-C-methyl-D-erythritol kinase